VKAVPPLATAIYGLFTVAADGSTAAGVDFIAENGGGAGVRLKAGRS
jgi:hypothetical protein